MPRVNKIIHRKKLIIRLMDICSCQQLPVLTSNSVNLDNTIKCFSLVLHTGYPSWFNNLKILIPFNIQIKNKIVWSWYWFHDNINYKSYGHRQLHGILKKRVQHLLCKISLPIIFSINQRINNKKMALMLSLQHCVIMESMLYCTKPYISFHHSYFHSMINLWN